MAHALRFKLPNRSPLGLDPYAPPPSFPMNAPESAPLVGDRENLSVAGEDAVRRCEALIDEAVAAVDLRFRFACVDATLAMADGAPGGTPVEALLTQHRSAPVTECSTWLRRVGDVALALQQPEAASRAYQNVLLLQDEMAAEVGDEFLMLFPGAALEVATHASVRLLQLIRRLPPDVVVGDADFLPRVSIGMAMRRAGEDMKSLLRRADAALYEAKAEGRGQYRVAAA